MQVGLTKDKKRKRLVGTEKLLDRYGVILRLEPLNVSLEERTALSKALECARLSKAPL